MDNIEYKVSKKSGLSSLKASLLYFRFHLILIAFIALNNYLITRTGTEYDFENLLKLNFTSAFFLFAIMAVSLVVFYNLFFLFKKVKKLELSFLIRFVLYLLIGVMVFGCYQYLTDFEIPWIAAALSYTTIFLLADLFLFERDQNLSWLMSWIIVLAGFTSILVYHYYLQYD